MHRIIFTAKLKISGANQDENELPFVSSTASRWAQESNNNHDVNDPNYIPTREINWNGYRLNIDYKVSTLIADSALDYGVYSDRKCTREISDSKAMEIVLLTDPALNEDEESMVEEGTRMVRLTILMSQTEILDESYVSFSNSNAIVSFCTRLWVKGSAEVGTEQEDYLIMEVDIGGANGILGLVPDPFLNWGVDVFRCGTTFEEIAYPMPVMQGQLVRICLTPDQATRTDGVYMSTINSFNFRRGGVVQNAVTDGQLSDDSGATEILCNQGSELCAIDTVLHNDFFESTGEVLGTGQVFLQFGFLQDGRRYLRTRRVEFEWPAESGRMRCLYERGEIVGEKPVSYNVEVEPSSEIFTAEAFRCNHQNERLTDATAVFYGDSVRICVVPNAGAREAGVFIRRIESFSFQRDGGEHQIAIDSAGVEGEDGKTLAICSRGDDMCSIKTELAKWFFVSGSPVKVTGDVILQYGTDRHSGGALIVSRRLQDNEGSGEDSDPGFAGRTEVSAEFTVAFSRGATTNPRFWWDSSPAYMKALYAFAIAVSCLIVLCCIFGCIYFIYRRRKAKDFVVIEIMNVNMKEADDSVDARIDSKASFYSDLEFDTDAEDDSSDEESISEKFEDDLEDKVAILFPSNLDPKDFDSVGCRPFFGGGRSQSAPPDFIGNNSLSIVDVSGNDPIHSLYSGRLPQRKKSKPPQNPMVGSKSEVGTTSAALSVPPRKQAAFPPGGQDAFSRSLHESRYGTKPNQLCLSNQAQPPQRKSSLQGIQRMIHPPSQSEHGTTRKEAPTRKASLRLQQHIPFPSSFSTSMHDEGAQRRLSSPQSGRTERDPSSTSIPVAGRESETRATQKSLNAPQRPSGKDVVAKRCLSQSEHRANTREPSLEAHKLQSTSRQKEGAKGGPSQPDHRIRGGQGHPKPKGGKMTLKEDVQNGDRYYQPDGLTRVPRVQAKKTPLKHPPFAKGDKISKKYYSKCPKDSTDPCITTLGKKKATVAAKKASDAAKKASELRVNINPKKSPGKIPVEVLPAGYGPAKKKSPSSAKKFPATDVAGTGKSNCKKVNSLKGMASLIKPTKKKKVATNVESLASTDCTSTGTSDSSDEETDIPCEEDVCFEYEGHPGTDAFMDAIRKTLYNIGPAAYSPRVYRQIKRQLPGRRFFVCEDDSKPDDWREVKKSELIDLVWKYYEDGKSEMYGVRIEEEPDDCKLI